MSIVEQKKYKNGRKGCVRDHRGIGEWKGPQGDQWMVLTEIVRIIPGGKEVQSCEEDRGHLGPGMKNDGDRKKEERENVLLVLTVWSMR